MLPHLELIERIAFGAVCGGVIGFERDLHGRPVGFRTHLIVAMTAATFMVISTHFVYFQHYGKDQPLAVDPSRIAASVVSGIGFLAGGAILRTGLSVQGMTTAAGLWLVTAIGMSAGAGMFIESGSVTLLGLIILSSLRRFDVKEDLKVRRKVMLTFDHHPKSLGAILDEIRVKGGGVGDIEYEKNISENNMAVSFEVQTSISFNLRNLTELLESRSEIVKFRIVAINNRIS